MYLKSTGKYMKSLEHFQTGHVGWSLELRETESGHEVGRSSEVQRDLGMAHNTNWQYN